MAWKNADGLEVLMHGEQGEVNNKGVTVNSEDSQLVIDLDFTEIPAAAAKPMELDPFIPAGSYITGAHLIMTEGADAAGAATLTIGTYTKAGNTVDADGIDAAVALAALAANKAVACDGAAVGGTATVGAADVYIEAIVAVGPYTKGKGKLVIDYITV